MQASAIDSRYLSVRHTGLFPFVSGRAPAAVPRWRRTASCAGSRQRHGRRASPLRPHRRGGMEASASGGSDPVSHTPEGFQEVLFVEAGWGADQHGQSGTKAAVRACRNAIEFNSLPAIRRLVPNGYDGLKLLVKIGVPEPDSVDLEECRKGFSCGSVAIEDSVDVEECRKVFPYGSVTFEVVDGGLRANSGVAIAALGDKNADMYIAVAAVTVGF